MTPWNERVMMVAGVFISPMSKRVLSDKKPRVREKTRLPLSRSTDSEIEQSILSRGSMPVR